MQITGVNQFVVVQGEQAYLPFVLVDNSKSPVYLTPYWQRITVKIKNGAAVIVKTTDQQSEIYCYYAGPGAFFTLKLEPVDTRSLVPNVFLDVVITLETTAPGFEKSVYTYAQSIKALVPPVAG